MIENLSDLVWGGLGGGIVAVMLRAFEKAWIDIKIGESIEAKRKLKKYAKPFWLACNELEWRFNHIIDKIESNQGLEPLLLKLELNRPLHWYIKEGYYITSTAYLIANVAAWIRLFESDVVFLQFSKNSKTAEFYRMVESFKGSISKDPPSILWYHYLNGIGDNLIENESPISIADFSNRLATNPEFNAYYDQLFQFLNSCHYENMQNIYISVNAVIKDIKLFLERNGAVPHLSGSEYNSINRN